MKRIFFILLFFSVILSQNSLAKQPLIAASINPIYQIILAITQDKSNVSLIIDPNFSEHDYSLKNSDVKNVINADLVFYISDNLEQGIAKLVKNYNKRNNSYQLIKVQGIKVLSSRRDSDNLDQHIWLNPDNAIKIAEFVAKKLSEVDTENAVKYKSNLDKFIKEVLKTKESIVKNLAHSSKVNYIFYHDGYQYFESYFNVKPLMLVSSDHDQELTIRSMKEFDSLVKEKNVKCIFGDIQDEKDSAKKLAEKYQIKFLTLDLMGSKENESNSYLVLLKNVAKSLESCDQ